MFCIAVLRKVTQAFEGGGPILLMLRKPRRQFVDQCVRFESIHLLSPLRAADTRPAARKLIRCLEMPDCTRSGNSAASSPTDKGPRSTSRSNARHRLDGGRAHAQPRRLRCRA